MPSDPYATVGSGDPYGHVGGAKPSLKATAMDMAKSGWGGLISGLGAAKDMMDPALTAERSAEFGARMVGNKKVADAIHAIQPPSTQAAAGNIGGDYQPQTTAGRYAHSISEMAPAALDPEAAIPARIAATVLPGVVGQGADDAAGAAGAGPTGRAIAHAGGAIFGGGLTGVPRAVGGFQAATAAKAIKPVAQAVKAAIQTGGTPEDVLQARLNAGTLPVAADPHGLGALGEAVATVPGRGQTILRAAAKARVAGTTDRAFTAARDTLGINPVASRTAIDALRKPGDTGQTFDAVRDALGVDPQTARGGADAVTAAGQKAAAPLYDALTNDPAPVWNSNLARISKLPAIKKAIQIASNDIANEDRDPNAAGFALDPDTGLYKIADPNDPSSIAMENHPTAETWIRTHQALGRTVERDQFTNRPLPDTASEGNKGINSATRVLRTALAGDGTAENPGAISGYSDALAQSGDYLSQQGAYDRASGKLFGNTPVYDFTKMVGSFKTPAEQTAARAAIGNDILEAADRGRDVASMFDAPGVQQKLGLAFGGEPASSFLSRIAPDPRVTAYDKTSGLLFGRTNSVQDFADHWASLGSDGEQDAARSAIGNDILEAADNGQYLPGKFKAPAVQQKLAIAFGDQPAANFTDQMEANANEKGVLNNILEGSPTARREALKQYYSDQAGPTGGGIIPKLTSATNTIASFMHPVTAMTKLADMAAHGGGGGKVAPALPWADPTANEQLGGLLSDPKAMSDFVNQLDATINAPKPFAAGVQGLLSAPAQQAAAPAITMGVLGYNPPDQLPPPNQ